MASTISSPPNHYDALGLAPTATEDEIIKAFGKAMGLFGARSAAKAAQLGMAFETLRNREKRRAYDKTLGLKREPPPAPAPMALSFRITARPVAAESHVEPAPDPGPASFIASSLLEIARPVDVDPSRRPAAQPRPTSAEPLVAATLKEENVADADDRPIDWKRPAVAVGAVVLAAGLVGALAGASVKGDEQGQSAVTAALPAAKVRSQAAAPTGAEPVIPVEAAVAPAGQPVRAQRVRKRPQQRSTGPSALPDTTQGGSAASASSDPAQPPDGQPTADPLAPQPGSSIETVTAAAGLPIGSNLTARTIERIGYSCGEVASTSAVDGAAGVYKVTCTSGLSFRAAPVHGRYRFKRW